MGAPSAPHRRAATSSVAGQVAGARRTLYGYSLRRLSRSMAIGHVACAFFSLASCGAGWRRPLLHALRRCRLRRGGECRRRSAVTSLVNSGVSLCMGGETYWTAGRLSGAAGTRCGARSMVGLSCERYETLHPLPSHRYRGPPVGSVMVGRRVGLLARRLFQAIY